MKNTLRALTYFRAEAPRLAGVFLLMLASIGLNVLKPWPLAVIVDSVLGGRPLPKWLISPMAGLGKPEQVAVLSLAILGLHLGQGALSVIQNFLSIQVGLRGLTRVRNEVFAKLHRLSLRYHQGSSSGDLIYRASWDTYAFQTLFQQGLVTFLTAALSLVMMVAVMARLNLGLTVVALCLVPVLIGTVKFFGRKMSERTAEAQQADSRVTSQVQQSIGAMQLIQSNTREASELGRFGQRVSAAEEKRAAQHGSELLYWFGIATVFGVGTAGITWLGADEVLAGNLTVGQLLVFLSYLALLFEPLNQLSQVGATVAGASAGTRRVFDILDAPEEVREAPDARSVTSGKPEASPKGDPVSLNTTHAPLIVRGEIEFEKVSFAYENDRLVLREVSFHLDAGETVALIGPSGAGKTTLLNLLPRFFDPTSGAVKLDGVDVRQLKLKELRAQMALVLQQPILLPGTLAENIAYGKMNASREEIEAAARAANADGFIRRLPKGYDTPVGDGAARLSVGEQQRINLARAFLKDAPILLLDEPTSALDAESESLVLQSLHKLMRGRTTLVVAHKLETIRQANKILVLEEGRLTEIGSPEELDRKQGYYARLLARR